MGRPGAVRRRDDPVTARYMFPKKAEYLKYTRKLMEASTPRVRHNPRRNPDRARSMSRAHR